ncbi:MAG: GDSL-type esterase/lipase family protein [Catenulispora sp.]
MSQEREREREREPEQKQEPVTTARQAGRVIRIALLTALLLNTAGVVRAGLGMAPGPTRDILLDLARPLDSAAHLLDLDGPRTSLDAMLGHPDSATGDGTRTHLEQDAAKQQPVGGRGSAPRSASTSQPATSPEPHLAPVAAAVRRPTRENPLRILVTGDSLADFDGQQLARIVTARHLPAKVRVEARNGTGLTQPDVFDWSDEALAEAADYDPDVVVMVLGANDGWPLAGAGAGVARWVAEYSRRVAAVTRDFLAGDPRRRVYWVGPPVPRSAPWIHIFERINAAIQDVVPSVPGLRYVDVAGPTSEAGRYTDYLTDADGRRVLARQHDGIHFSFPGSVFPARIILAALRGEYTVG